jgi:DNA polymerase-3 subunit delta'
MGFDSFIGNPKALERLKNKLRENRFPHALIFAGPEGVGKRTLALMIAKALNCTSLGPADFCDECAQCRKINAGTHPDVLQVTLEDEATQIKIAQIRRVLALLGLQPLEGRNKVFIIDPANLMNEESSNALLKGLEEPPDNSFFILLTVNLHELLLTIRSRAQVYQFAPLLLDEIRARNVDELAVRWSQGSIGRAQTLDIAAIKEQRESVLEFFEACVNARDETLREVLSASAELSRTRQDFAAYIHVMSVLLADLLRVAVGAGDRIVNIDLRPRLEGIAGKAPTQRWIRVGEFLLEVEIALKSHVNRQMLTDVMALQTADISSGI